MNIYNQNILIDCQPPVFGDGNHETTRFLLYFLSRYAKGKTYIDVGCGSGILSIFASKLGAKVTAIDFDHMAIKCARNNIEVNDADIEVIFKNVLEIELKADIITANFARHEALGYITKLKQMVNDGGLLITTWFKELPIDDLNWEIIDHIEGIEYDAYVLKKSEQ